MVHLIVALLVLVLLVREFISPYIRVENTFSTEMLLGATLRQVNPDNPKQRPLVAVLNFDNVTRVQFTFVACESHASLSCIERVRWFTLLVAPSESHPDGHHHFPSAFSPLTRDESGHLGELCT